MDQVEAYLAVRNREGLFQVGVLKFLGVEAHHIPTFEHPYGEVHTMTETTTRTLGHACRGTMIDSCNQWWTFKPHELDEAGLTQLDALETMICATCTPERLIKPEPRSLH